MYICALLVASLRVRRASLLALLLFPFFLFIFLQLLVAMYLVVHPGRHTRAHTHRHTPQGEQQQPKRNEVGLFIHLFECVPLGKKKRNTTTTETKRKEKKRRRGSCWKNDASTIFEDNNNKKNILFCVRMCVLEHYTTNGSKRMRIMSCRSSSSLERWLNPRRPE